MFQSKGSNILVLSDFRLGPMQSAMFFKFFYLSVASFLFFQSGLLCAVLNQSLFHCRALSKHTTDPEITTLNDFLVFFHVEGRRTELKDQANMHKVFRFC